MMKINKEIMLGIVLGMAILGSVFFLMGAVDKNTANIDTRLVSQYPMLNVACSADGSQVYVGDYDRVYRSGNFGKDWTIILSGERKSKF
jgi:photosystem II stability/assembly factor-like uncharacterized protein